VCGIFGYIGNKDAAPILIQGLQKLEYRGYDSFGLAICSPRIQILKKFGRISDIDGDQVALEGKMGIGHTRWATHGIPSDQNAHPHTDCTGTIAVVHNGIIENYAELKRDLVKKGHQFSSETDTEVVAHLIEECYDGDLLSAVRAVLPKLEGSYAFLITAVTEDRIVAARKASPLVLGVGDAEYFAASDVTPLLAHTQRVVFLEDDDLAVISSSGIQVYRGEQVIERPVERIEWDVDSARKGGFEHFMLKEIYEQPAVYYDTLSSIDRDEFPDWLNELSLLHRPNSISCLTVVGCGTSYHAGLIFRYLMEKYAEIPVRVELGSEFKYFSPPLTGLVIAVTQSGETADTVAALKKAEQHNCHTLSITNVLGSSITRISEHTLFMRAGPEISVAATKSFIAQLAVFFQIINLLCESAFSDELHIARQAIEEVLLYDLTPAVELCRPAEHIFYVGRGVFYPVALEGALKMKEITYIHAEGYAAGELKHGPFSLLSENTPVVALCFPGDAYSAMVSNIKEMKARGAPIIGIGTEKDRDLEEIVDIMIGLPATGIFGAVLTSTVVLQLLAYHTARSLARDIDKPRHLAKSVTVE
jgi:glucosamine--fructose-6-phosphate aminotransferase (isomerizing)